MFTVEQYFTEKHFIIPSILQCYKNGCNVRHSSQQAVL